MSVSTIKIATLHDLLDFEARRYTSAEIILQKHLHDWIGMAGSLKLKAVLRKYDEFISDHIQKFERFFEEDNISSLSLENKLMEAYISDLNEKLECCTDAEVRDACLLAGIQAVNHFKISYYGTAAAFANTLGKQAHAAIFHEAEAREKQIDDRLSQLAEFEINRKAKPRVILHR